MVNIYERKDIYSQLRKLCWEEERARNAQYIATILYDLGSCPAEVIKKDIVERRFRLSDLELGDLLRGLEKLGFVDFTTDAKYSLTTKGESSFKD